MKDKIKGVCPKCNSRFGMILTSNVDDDKRDVICFNGDCDFKMNILEWNRRLSQEPLSDEDISKAFIAGRNSNDLYARLKGIPTSATEYLNNYHAQLPCDKPLNKGFSASDSTEQPKDNKLYDKNVQPPKDEVVEALKCIDESLSTLARLWDNSNIDNEGLEVMGNQLHTIEQALKGGEE